jgi:thiamine transport system permease protein
MMGRAPQVGPGSGRLLRRAVVIVPAGFLLLFFAYPVVTLIVTALAGEGAWGRAWAALATPRIAGVLAFTAGQAALSTVLTVLIALPGAWVLATFRFRGRGLIQALSVVAFVMPTVVVAAAIGAVLADDGPLAWLLPTGSDRGLGAILAAHIYFNLAVVLRMVGSYWSQLDPRVAEAAAVLGASPWRTFRTVTLPRLRPAILAAASIVFLFTFTSFGIVLLLGAPGQATIEVEIQRQVLFLFNVPAGAALSLLQVMAVLAILLVQTALARGIAAGGGSVAHQVRARTAAQRAAVALFAVGGLAVFAFPPLLVLARAVRTPTGWGWGNFAALAAADPESVLSVSALEAVGHSLLFAAMATLIAMVVGGLMALGLARRGTSVWEGVWLLPLGVSAVTLGFGILIAFDSPPLDWRGSPLMVPVAQALVAIPFVVRALVPALRAISPRVLESAAVLGASPRHVLRFVELPLAGRALLVAAGFSLAISLGEFGATVFVARGDRPTVPIAIYRLLGTPGAANQGQAMALASLLILLTAGAVLLTDRLRLPGERHV